MVPYVDERSDASQPPLPCPIVFSSLRGICFDIDGTLCDSDPLHFAAFRELLAERGFQEGTPIDEAFFRAHISGRHNPEIARDLFPDQTEAWRQAFYEEKEQRYRALAGSGLQRLRGLTQFMAWIETRGLRRVAVTNAPRANAMLMLAALGMDTWFEAVILGEECARAKPFADPYIAGLARMGLQAAECLVLEDSPAGVAAGVAAGIAVVGITTGQPEAALRKAGAVWVVPSFEELVNAVKGQASGSVGVKL